MRNLWNIGAALGCLLGAAGCVGASESPGPKTPGDEGVVVSPPEGEGGAPGAKSPGGASEGDGNGVSTKQEPPPGPFACKLPAPVSSDDACTKDADCAPADPCHAHACVAASKARPRTPDTVCTMNIDCSSADVNRCTCYQGRCALVPPEGN